MPQPTIERINNTWRVCSDGVCKEHRQEWQALIFFHQLLNNPSVHAAALDGCQDAQSL
jgi:hypothetical protein